MNSFNKDLKKIMLKYWEVYRVSGVSMMLYDIIRNITSQYNVMAAYERGTLRHFVMPDIFKPLFLGALDLCSDTRALDAHLNKANILDMKTRKFFKKVINKSKVDISDWRQTVKWVEKIIYYYLIFDFDYFSEEIMQKYPKKTRRNFTIIFDYSFCLVYN